MLMLFFLKTLVHKPQQLFLTLKSLENDKGFDIVSIDLVGRSSIADYMIVASGNTVRQVTAMANNLIKKYKEAGIKNTFT